MKKLSVILLLAAMALPMMAQTAATKAEAMGVKPDKATIEQGVTTPLKAFDWTLNPVNRAEQTFFWGFEEENDLEGWMSLDNDGDGNGWEIESYYAHTGSYSLTSRSYYGGALDPDNWLISPEVPLGGTLSLWAMNYMSSWPDNFAIYVCIGTPTTADDFVAVSDLIAPPADWNEYTFDLSAFAGQTGCFAIRHYDSYNQFRLFVDDITLTAPAAAMPENLYAEPDMESAEVTWDDEENVAWNLRYREYVEQPVPDGILWDFEEDTDDNTNISLPGGWTSIDQDGDGNEWYHLNGVVGLKAHSGLGHVTSASYNGAALTPDNWLVSPEVTLKGELRFWACGQDASYAAEVFAVYVSVGNRDWVKISDDITATGEMTEYVFSLSEYEGQTGQVAIRHYNTYDMFRLNVDDIFIGIMPEPVEEPEWIVVEDVTSPYTIEGLTPETTYEVQVQGVNDEGMTSAWTESFIFTTTEDVAVEEIVTEVKGDNNYYNLMGQKVDAANLTTGIYIHNGKKVLVK